MTRSELKQLIRETIEEISADTARRAADKARQLGRHGQSDRLSAAAQKKDDAAIGGDPSLGKVALGGHLYSATIKKIGIKENGKVGVQIEMETGHKFTLVDDDPVVTTTRGYSIAVSRPARVKLVKAFKHAGVNLNANKINVID
jgi:hypothetical protein